MMIQQELSEISDEKLIWLCVELIIKEVRGKDPETKSSVIADLNDGLRALFLFQTLYGHAAQGISRFFLQISYLTFDIWAALKSSMSYFDVSEMLILITKMEQLYYSDLKKTPNLILLTSLTCNIKPEFPKPSDRLPLVFVMSPMYLCSIRY